MPSAAARRSDSFFAAREHEGTSDSAFWQALSRALCVRTARCAILLIGGDKTGNDRWYEEFVPVADGLYDRHLEALKKEQEKK